MFIVWFKNSFWLSWRLGGTRLQEKLDSTANVKIIFLKTHLTLLSPFSKFNLKFDRVNLVAPAFLLSVCFIYPMCGRYSTNWDRKDWPGSEIQMYYGCQWNEHNFVKGIFILYDTFTSQCLTYNSNTKHEILKKKNLISKMLWKLFF